MSGDGDVPLSGLGEPAVLRLCLQLPHRWTPLCCCLLSHQRFCACTIPAGSMLSSFYECPSCSTVFLHGSSLSLPCPAPCAAPQPTAGRPIPVISFFCCILQNGSSCQAHFASQSLTDWPTCNFSLCVYRRWRTEGKGGCRAREEGTEKKEITNPPSKSCFPTCGFKMLPPSPAIL